MPKAVIAGLKKQTFSKALEDEGHGPHSGGSMHADL
jgi:hypothetical protein